jgi:hypothetical protein
VKHFVSIEFLNLRQSVGLLGRGTNETQDRYLHKHRINADKYPFLELDPSVLAGEISSYLRTRGHCDRLSSCNPHLSYIGEDCKFQYYKPVALEI